MAARQICSTLQTDNVTFCKMTSIQFWLTVFVHESHHRKSLVKTEHERGPQRHPELFNVRKKHGNWSLNFWRVHAKSDDLTSRKVSDETKLSTKLRLKWWVPCIWPKSEIAVLWTCSRDPFGNVLKRFHNSFGRFLIIAAEHFYLAIKQKNLTSGVVYGITTTGMWENMTFSMLLTNFE